MHVYHERLALEEGTGNDNLRGYFGADSYLSYLESNNTLTIAATTIDISGSLDIAGSADIDGTLEADAITVNGTTLNELIQDTVGLMVESNSEDGISVAYQDSDGTLDFTVGTLNQNTTGSSGSCTGNAATATKFAASVNIGGVAFDGSANIDLPGVSETGDQDTSGNAALQLL